jgi:hypothetical protein
MELWNTRMHSPGSDVDVTLIPPSTPDSAQVTEGDLEGDTLVAESSPHDKQYLEYEDGISGSSDDEFDANADTLIVDDGRYMVQQKAIDVEQERVRRQLESRKLCNTGWSEDSIFLYQKLGMRGHEPLFPIDWIDDFMSFPEDLFTANVDKAFIKPAFGSTYHGMCPNPWSLQAYTNDPIAQLALSNICDLGSIVRDAWLTKAHQRTPSFHIRRGVERFTAWAMKDADVKHVWGHLPLFYAVAWHRKAEISVCEAKLLRKLDKLYNMWQDALHYQSQAEGASSTIPEVPTLYGVASSHTVVAFVSYSPPTEDHPTSRLRLIASLDFGKEEADVWNSLAVAIFVIHCRNRMTQLKEYLPELPCSAVEEDPDL